MSGRKPHILLVDDDVEILELTKETLERQHYHVITAGDSTDAYEHLQNETVDLAVLDINLPGEDGISICQNIRRDYHIPIIMLTASQEKADLLVSLGMGADIFLNKPFDPKILLAYIKSSLRRSHQDSQAGTVAQEVISNDYDIYMFEHYMLNTGTRQLLTIDETEIILTAAEYNLLYLFLCSPQRVLSRDHLSDSLHNRESLPFDRSIDVLISRLRQKIETTPKEPKLVKTVRGGGYILTTTVKKQTQAA